jgi:hypothetical protein
MATTVSAPANHYELLGIAPDASEAEIDHAFAREISSLKPRAFGGITEVSVAYRTLRDPERRLDYDKAIGIERRPAIAAGGPLGLHLEMHMTPPARRQDSVGGFIASALRAAEKPKADSAEAPKADPIEERTITEAVNMPGPFVARQVAAVPLPAVEPLPLPLAEAWPEERESAVEWKRPGLTIGALFVGVALVGAAAGLWSQREIASPASASVPLPEPNAAAAAPVTEKAATPALSPVPAVQQQHPAVPSAVSPRRAGPKQVAANETRPVPADQSVPQLAEVDQAAETPVETASAPVEAEPATEAPAPAATVAMPLAASTVARIIHKIGYPCGRVASSAPAGDSGVFIVTCSSGDSYRAAPVGGRYHFKRLGKH